MISVLSLGVILNAATMTSSPAALSGVWNGGYSLADTVTAVTLETGGEAAPTAVIRRGGAAAHRVRVTETHAQGGAFRAALADSMGPIDLEGTWRGGLIEGRARQGPRRGRFALVRVMPPDSARTAGCVGVYRFGLDDLLEIQASDAGDGNLFFVEATGRAGPPRAVSASDFVAGPNFPTRSRSSAAHTS